MQSNEGKNEYKKRKETVEWPFGNIKQNLGLREFLTKGIKNVGIEFNLGCVAHNLIIIWGKLKENSKLYAEFMQYCGFSDGISS